MNLNDFLDKRKLAQARIQTFLVVDKPEYAEKSEEIFTK
jgi:predicted XRE-type DNA-binding protein